MQHPTRNSVCGIGNLRRLGSVPFGRRPDNQRRANLTKGKHRSMIPIPLLLGSLVWCTMILFSSRLVVVKAQVVVAAAADDSTPDPPILPMVTATAEKRGFISATLGSNMVLQRDQESVIWGYTQAGRAVVTTELDDGNIPELFLTTSDADGLWRQVLPARPASLEPVTLYVEASTGESAELSNILFGDVYICGGQSNMEFSLPHNINASAEAEAANLYPHIRLFSVGQATSSVEPLADLQTVQQEWAVANASSVFAPGGGVGGYFSAVCWFFGRTLADGLENEIPIGLVSNNWGGTTVEQWSTPNALALCNHTVTPRDMTLYNAMIHPYTIGPMAITGFTWYQGEANVGRGGADKYKCSFPAMIQAWRDAMGNPSAYFGFVQLSTWCPTSPWQVAEMREAQLSAWEDLPNVGYSTNADYGFGCNIHPPNKRPCSERLAHSALALVYGDETIHWRSPSYHYSVVPPPMTTQGGGVVVQLRLLLNDVSDSGLQIIAHSYNEPYVNCTEQVAGTCAWASIQVSDYGWVHATISIVDNKNILLTANLPESNASRKVLGSSYGWGSVPMLTVYDAGTNLPVLPWSRTIAASSDTHKIGLDS